METSIPTQIEQITAEWLTGILQQVGVIRAAQVEHVKATLLESDKGFIGQIARLELTYSKDENAPHTMIAKFSSSNPEMREIGSEYGFYSREVNFYKFLASHVNLATPKYYYSEIDDTGESHILLIEDLSDLENGNRFLGCSYHDALQVVTQFAGFHAQWWETSELTNLFWLPDLDTVYDFSQTPETFEAAWKVFKQKMGSIPFYVLEIGERYSEHVIEVLNTLFQTSPRALLHFDLHLDNLFFLRTVTHTQAIVVDWQLITRGRGIVDIACFLGQNLESKIRRQHELELLESYYRGLVNNGVQGYSFQDCWHDYRLALLFHLFGFVFSLGVDSFTNDQEKFLIEHIIPRNMIAVEDLNTSELLS